MKKTNVWWLKPVDLYSVLMIFVLFANDMSSRQYSSLYGMEKGIELKYFGIYVMLYILFIIGFLLSKKYRMKIVY